MKYEDIERQPFEEFGEIEASFDAPETNQDDDASDRDAGQDIDLSTTEEVEFTQAEPAADADAIETIEPAQPSHVKTAFSWAGFSGGLAALVWIGGAIGGPLSYYGVDAVMAMDPAMQAGLIALAFGPAILFWLAAAAAGEAMKARALAVELTRLARDGARSPLEAGETHVQRLSLSVKTEIEALNDAVDAAFTRLNELQSVAQRNTAMFDGAVAATREHADYMAGHLAREREELSALNTDMRGQTDTMAQTISRQIRLMREASKLVKTEITAAEDALETHLESFERSAAVMADQTSAFHHAADNASTATSSLTNTMSQMLDGLSEATRMTDAARQSSEQAVLAANETAAAVRETTRSAVFEAKRAAQLIRAETVAMQDAAAETLANLQAVARAAREASDESQAAADRHAASIEKRLGALASTASAPRKPAQPPAQPRQAERAPVAAPSRPAVQAVADAEAHTLRAAANAAVSRAARQPAKAEAQPEPRQSRGFPGGFKGIGTWGNFLPHTSRDYDAPKAANEAHDAFDLVDFGEPKSADAQLQGNALDLVASAGVDLDTALVNADLERIARESRNGAVARRRAVADAAPAAVSRIARHVKRSDNARLMASEFRSRPDLAKSENKSEGSDLVRAYLLIDAALA